MKCEYCDQTESAIFSPFVYGQTRQEFDFYEKMTNGTVSLDNVIENTKNTKIKFCVLKEEIAEQNSSASLVPPYHPLVHPKGVQYNKATRKQLKDKCPIVHEICALNMFHARVHRERWVFSVILNHNALINY